MSRRRTGPKRILQQSITAEQGIALIYRRCLDMGFLWYPSGGVEAGIDGHFELRDDVSGEVLNSIVQVQSKATRDPLGAPGASTFDFVCEQRDIDYWMKGNAPVILVRSRPETGEAYWKSIKDYFADPKRRLARKIVFDKTTDAFDAQAKERLRQLAVSVDVGVYFAPPPTQLSTRRVSWVSVSIVPSTAAGSQRAWHKFSMSVAKEWWSRARRSNSRRMIESRTSGLMTQTDYWKRP